MATPFEEIYDLALTRIRDYQLDSLYNSDQPNFYRRMESFLVNAVPRFDNSRTSLSYTIDTGAPQNSTFINTLDNEEKNVLSILLVVEWFERTVNTKTQFQLHLQDSNFKTFAEANNLKTKADYLSLIREDAERVKNTYGWYGSDITITMGAS